ncbi:hypothetical protein E1286_14910 [Nonomuraea terrae]|uniref:YtkA-like domain-containing protein n=1 Tax=Nonomuraea terrae TaxID=2530383 RepID=A0A4V2YM94_9ACTN|nr:hypothetical protein [Nonomuraea terrae]TDD48897.1 hypothetical protein E1286_14910 [Nonomuraea terrae]
MKRLAVVAVLVAAAVALFVAGRNAAAEPLRTSTTGTRYAATVLIEEPVTGRVSMEVVVDSGDADTVAVSAVMPEMGHSTPEITAREQRPGRFLAEGELFSMSGVWDVSLRLDGPAGEEQLIVKALISDR